MSYRYLDQQIENCITTLKEYSITPRSDMVINFLFNVFERDKKDKIILGYDIDEHYIKEFDRHDVFVRVKFTYEPFQVTRSLTFKGEYMDDINKNNKFSIIDELTKI